MNYAWETRFYTSSTDYSIEAAVAKALTYHVVNPVITPGPISLVMADVTDNPGSGHYGDTTNLLKGDKEQS